MQDWIMRLNKGLRTGKRLIEKLSHRKTETEGLKGINADTQSYWKTKRWNNKDWKKTMQLWKYQDTKRMKLIWKIMAEEIRNIIKRDNRYLYKGERRSNKRNNQYPKGTVIVI